MKRNVPCLQPMSALRGKANISRTLNIAVRGGGRPANAGVRFCLPLAAVAGARRRALELLEVAARMFIRIAR